MNPLLDLSAHPIIAHRGASGWAPENTMAAFDLAVRQGADAFELDVRLTGDGVPVVLHDPTLDRTTDRAGPLAGLSLDDLRRADAGARFSSDGGRTFPYRNAGVTVPPLAEVLRAFPELPVLIEIKEVAAQEAVRQLLIEERAVERCVLASEQEPALELFREPPFTRGASGREISLPIRAGLDTAEWAWDRPDVRSRVAHYRAPVAESFPGPDGSFQGHRYQAVLRLPGRYWVDGVRLEHALGRGVFTLHRVAVFDAVSGRAAAASASAGFVSDTGRFREAAATPGVRLFELPSTSGRASVVERLRTLPGEPEVLQALAALTRAGVDPHLEAVGLESDVAGVTLPAGSRASRAEVVRARPGWVDVRAEGPGLLVVTDAWDRGWRARLDDGPARLLRVNHGEMGVVTPEGWHRVTLAYRPEGLGAGIALAAAGVGALAYQGRRARRGKRV